MVRISTLLLLSVLLESTDSLSSEDKDRVLVGTVNLQLQERLSSLRREVYSNLQSFKEWFYKATEVTEKNSKLILQKTYGPFFEENPKVLDSFFLRLQSFNSPFSLETTESLTEELMNQLFREAFTSLNPTLEITDARWNCMLSNVDQVKPFGPLHQAIRTHLDRPVVSWRNFTQALEKTHQLLGGIVNHAQVSGECLDLLRRLEEFRTPCSCSLVLRECLADVEALDENGWNQIVDSLLLLSDSLDSLPNTLSHLPVQISEALQSFQENGPVITNKILTVCFHEKKYTRSKRSISPSRIPQHQMIEQIESLDLEQSQKRFSTLKDWFSSLSHSLCQDHSSYRSACSSRRPEKSSKQKGSLDSLSLELSLLSIQLAEMTESTGLEAIYFDEEYDYEDFFSKEIPKDRPSSCGHLFPILLVTVLLVLFL